MSDSNEMNTKPKNSRLRLSEAGAKAQEAHDQGEPLTSQSYANRMNDLMLDMLNGRVERHDALAIVQVGNSILKAAELELKNREMYYKYQYKHEQSFESPDPLLLAQNPRKNGRSK